MLLYCSADQHEVGELGLGEEFSFHRSMKIGDRGWRRKGTAGGELRIKIPCPHWASLYTALAFSTPKRIYFD